MDVHHYLGCRCSPYDKPKTFSSNTSLHFLSLHILHYHPHCNLFPPTNTDTYMSRHFFKQNYKYVCVCVFTKVSFFSKEIKEKKNLLKVTKVLKKAARQIEHLEMFRWCGLLVWIQQQHLKAEETKPISTEQGSSPQPCRFILYIKLHKEIYERNVAVYICINTPMGRGR